jgi:hypothetical protein
MVSDRLSRRWALQGVGLILLGCLCLVVFLQPGVLWAHYNESPARVTASPVESPNETLSAITYENLSSERSQSIFDAAQAADGPTVVYGSDFNDPAYKPFLTNEYVVYQNTTYAVEFISVGHTEAFWGVEPMESVLRYLIGGLGVVFVALGGTRALTRVL